MCFCGVLAFLVTTYVFYTCRIFYEIWVARHINPKNLDAWFGLFTHQIPINYFYKLAPENLRSREKAIFYADKMIEVAPNNPRSYNLRANIDRKDGNFEEAKKYYQKALDICNETGSSAKPTTLLVGGHNHMFSGDDETAMKFYQEAQDVAENGDSKRNMGFYKAILHLYNNDFYSAFAEFDKFQNQLDDYSDANASVIVVSMDSEDKAKKTQLDWGLDKLNIGYNLSLEDAKNWGLFISKSIKEAESDIFCEPGLFIIKKDGSIYMVNISNMPWARPDLSTFPAKLKFAQDNKYPVNHE